MGHVIGIDLGTTNSCVAIMEGSAAKAFFYEFIFHHGGYGTGSAAKAFDIFCVAIMQPGEGILL